MEDTDRLTITVSGGTAKWLRQYKREVEQTKRSKVFGQTRPIRWPEVLETLQQEFEAMRDHCHTEGILE